MTIRLKGKKLERLRTKVFNRANGKCESCGAWASIEDGHMAHIKSKGAGGPDTIDNVEWLCSECHRKEHNLGRYTFCKARRNKPRIKIDVCQKCRYYNECWKQKGE